MRGWEDKGWLIDEGRSRLSRSMNAGESPGSVAETTHKFKLSLGSTAGLNVAKEQAIILIEREATLETLLTTLPPRGPYPPWEGEG